ncbi:MAG: patatin-like phospholipase family protein [Muribaculaceae bacterium]|nr:patatin-like phospholipase family protein [Muribaculaceae bacterium]
MALLSLNNVSIDGLLEFAGFKRTPTYGVAFAGGGVRGFAHVGVVKALEEYGIRPQILSGVSAGSIAAVLYGAGLTPEDMLECFSDYQKFGDFTEFMVPTSGFFKLDKFGKMLDSWLPVKYLEELTIPTIVCATNYDKGTSVGWGKGEIVPRVLASCSIPILFKPMVINGVHYVDGGVLRNLPAWAIRDYCKVLIGSNCSPLNHGHKFKASIIDIAERSFQLMSKANVPQDIQLCDYVIMPQGMAGVKTFDLSTLKKNMRFGYEAACRVLDKITENK